MRSSTCRSPAACSPASDSGGVFYSVIAHPTDGTVWGAVPGPMPGRIVRIDPKTCVSRGLRAAVQQSRGQRQRLYAARHRRRHQRRDLDGARRQRPSRELRSAQVQSLVRACCDDGSALPRRLDAVSHAGPALQGRDATRSPSTCTTTTSSIASTRSASARTCRSRTARTPTRCSRCCPTAAGWCYACRIRSDSSRAAWTAASTIQTAGWKGRALYADYGPNAVWHIEGGKGTRSSLIKFQLRPDPLAK